MKRGLWVGALLLCAMACGGGGGGGTDTLVTDAVTVEYGQDAEGDGPGEAVTPEGVTEAQPEAVEEAGAEVEAQVEEALVEEGQAEALIEVQPEDQAQEEAVAEAAEEGPGDEGPEADEQPSEEVQAPRPVGWCRLQWPLELTLVVGEDATSYGRVFVEGITDKTSGTDEDPALKGQFGYGQKGSDPKGSLWTWVDGEANPKYDADEAGEPGNDEYMAQFSVAKGGEYDMAWRFSADGGATWTYCDKAAGPGHDGSEDGYQPENAGKLVVTDPCDPNPCTKPPMDACKDASVLLHYSVTGLCTVEAGKAVCDYGPTEVDCGAEGKLCKDGACVDPCDPNPCTTPPAATCDEDGQHLHAFEAEGECKVVAGAVECNYKPKDIDCAQTKQVCKDGACVEPPNPCDPNPCTNPPQPACNQDGKLISYPPLGNCTPDYLTPVCDYPEVVVDCAADGKECVDGACLYPVPQEAGALVVTEYMARSQTGDDPGEWVEVHNPGTAGLDLRGCLLSDAKSPHTDAHTIATSVPLGPGAYVVLAKSGDADKNHGLRPDYVYSNFNLSNSGDTIVISCGDTVIDQVTVPATPSWLYGISVQLEPGKTAAENDDQANWCWSIPIYGTTGERGTPGKENPACKRVVDWCNFQWPVDTKVPPQTKVTTYGRVEVAGLTDLTDQVDPYLPLKAQVGYGPDGTEPTVANWQWVDAVPTPNWSASANGADGKDEYTADLTLAIGTYDLAFRFSLDGGTTWTYCDTDGSQNGYSADKAASMAVIDPCNPNPCTTPEPDHCDETGLKVVSAVVPGTCTADGVNFTCTYAPKVTDCPAGKVCQNGACVNPCNPNPCTNPPPAICEPDGVTLRQFPATGECILYGTTVQCTYQPTLIDCSKTGRTCKDGACFGEEVLPPDTPGQVVVTEYMARPESGAASDGEWFEIYNASNKKLDLNGCTIRDDGTDLHVISGSLTFGPDEYLVLAASSDPAKNHGISPDYVYSNFILADDQDAIEIVCNGKVIDRVAYKAVVLGASAQLDPTHLDGTANDDQANWCVALVTYGPDGLYGTPGAANPACKWAVDWCRYQWPLQVNAIKGVETEAIYGHVYVAGVTDRSHGTDPVPALVAAVGYGPKGTMPDDQNWSWTKAAPNPGWQDTSEPKNDEYMAKVTPDKAGEFDVAYRFSLTGGLTWTYCDKAAGPGHDGSEDGYQPANAAAMTVTVADPCNPNPCDTPPISQCKDAKVLVTYSSPGTCTPKVGGGYDCAYAPQETDCSTQGKQCKNGACVDRVVNVFISEYVEGSSNNKALEIYNAGDPIAAGECVVNVYFNGATTPGTGSPISFPANASIPTNGTWVLCYTGVADTLKAKCNQFSSVPNFNGDDAIEVKCGGVVQDVFGKIGEDPGNGWPAASPVTVDKTLRRKCTVRQGDKVGNDAFDPNVEWDVFAIDTSDGLGTHSLCP